MAISQDGCFYFIIYHDKNWPNLELDYLLSLDSVSDGDTPFPLSKILRCSGLGLVTVSI